MDSAFLCGQLLIAMPAISDPRFERAVILICAHDDEHAMGVAVNRPLGSLTILDLLDRLDIKSDIEVPEDLVLMGGPVETGRGFVVHTDDFCAEFSIDVGEGFVLSATREALEAVAGRPHRPRHALLALGYAGWGAGQLEYELRENVWLTVAADEALVFDANHATKWTRAVAKLGIDPTFLTAEAGRA